MYIRNSLSDVEILSEMKEKKAFLFSAKLEKILEVKLVISHTACIKERYGANIFSRIRLEDILLQICRYLFA